RSRSGADRTARACRRPRAAPWRARACRPRRSQQRRKRAATAPPRAMLLPAPSCSCPRPRGTEAPLELGPMLEPGDVLERLEADAVVAGRGPAGLEVGARLLDPAGDPEDQGRGV